MDDEVRYDIRYFIVYTFISSRGIAPEAANGYFVDHHNHNHNQFN
jgi:hypothetical protein